MAVCWFAIKRRWHVSMCPESNQQAASRKVAREAGDGIKPRVSPRTPGQSRSCNPSPRSGRRFSGYDLNKATVPPFRVRVSLRASSTDSRTHSWLSACTPFGSYYLWALFTTLSTHSLSTGSGTHPWLYAATPSGVAYSRRTSCVESYASDSSPCESACRSRAARATFFAAGNCWPVISV